ncbi:MAG: GMC oxidoreductase [Microbacterium arborescens]
MATPDLHDVLIVGSGMMGAAVARQLRDADPGIRIAMIAGGPTVGAKAGQHLHDVEDPEVWAQYNRKVSSGVQAFYTGVKPSQGVGGSMRDVTPGMYHLTSLGEKADEMPSATVAWNAGGMGIHWTAATPTPWGSELDPVLTPDEWADAIARASDLLEINREPFPLTPAGETVARELRAHFDARQAPGREVQNMPMAVNDRGTGRKERTSPSVIFPALGDPESDAAFTFVANSMSTSLIHEGGRAIGAVCRDLATDETFEVHAAHVVVCADAIRTPQLLFASGIRPEALGRYLNEHYFLTGQVIADPERLGFAVDELTPPTDLEWASDCLWVPQSDDTQPFQVHIMTKTLVDEKHAPTGYAVGIEYYIRTEVQRDNRLEFSDTEVDAAGMPRITVHFTYTDADRDALESARADQIVAASRMGDFDPATESAALGAGGSLHYTGTVRMGAADDGTSVCDVDGRVWGFENLFVAGNGVVPTSLACNSTLIGMTSAVRAADALLRDLETA